MAYGGVHYLKAGFVTTPRGSAGIAAQQAQMGRFVDDFWQAPVAVNDLGHVVYDNPHYVLDLWGLASAQALEARLSGTDPLWADKLADEIEDISHDRHCKSNVKLSNIKVQSANFHVTKTNDSETS